MPFKLSISTSFMINMESNREKPKRKQKGCHSSFGGASEQYHREPGFQIRNPKSETNPKQQTQMLKIVPPAEFLTLKHWVFGFVSDFGFRIYARLGSWCLQDTHFIWAARGRG